MQFPRSLQICKIHKFPQRDRDVHDDCTSIIPSLELCPFWICNLRFGCIGLHFAWPWYVSSCFEPHVSRLGYHILRCVCHISYFGATSLYIDFRMSWTVFEAQILQFHSSSVRIRFSEFMCHMSESRLHIPSSYVSLLAMSFRIIHRYRGFNLKVQAFGCHFSLRSTFFLETTGFWENCVSFSHFGSPRARAHRQSIHARAVENSPHKIPLWAHFYINFHANLNSWQQKAVGSKIPTYFLPNFDDVSVFIDSPFLWPPHVLLEVGAPPPPTQPFQTCEVRHS